MKAFQNRSKKTELVAQRWFWWYLMQNDGKSISQIARETNFNHSTVIYGLRRFEELLKLKDEIIMNAMIEVANEIRENYNI